MPLHLLLNEAEKGGNGIGMSCDALNKRRDGGLRHKKLFAFIEICLFKTSVILTLMALAGGACGIGGLGGAKSSLLLLSSSSSSSSS